MYVLRKGHVRTKQKDACQYAMDTPHESITVKKISLFLDQTGWGILCCSPRGLMYKFNHHSHYLYKTIREEENDYC